MEIYSPYFTQTFEFFSSYRSKIKQMKMNEKLHLNIFQCNMRCSNKSLKSEELEAARLAQRFVMQPESTECLALLTAHTPAWSCERRTG